MSTEITDIARLRKVIDRIDPNELSRVGIFPLAGEADSDDELRQYVDQAREPAAPQTAPATGHELEALITREAHTDNAPLSFTVHEKSAWSFGVEQGIRVASAAHRREGWQPIETAPEGQVVVVLWFDSTDPENTQRHDFDFKEDGVWHIHNENYEHYLYVGGSMGPGPSERAPYTHWMPLPAAPAHGEPGALDQGDAS